MFYFVCEYSFILGGLGMNGQVRVYWNLGFYYTFGKSQKRKANLVKCLICLTSWVSKDEQPYWLAQGLPYLVFFPREMLLSTVPAKGVIIANDIFCTGILFLSSYLHTQIFIWPGQGMLSMGSQSVARKWFPSWFTLQVWLNRNNSSSNQSLAYLGNGKPKIGWTTYSKNCKMNHKVARDR